MLLLISGGFVDGGRLLIIPLENHKILNTYRFQDPNGREIAAFVHENRLIEIARTEDELIEL